jgi:hypothetical protein
MEMTMVFDLQEFRLEEWKKLEITI